MRRVVDGVNVGEGTGFASHPDYFFHVVDSADRIGCVPYSDQARVTGNLAAEVVHVEGALGFVDVNKPDSSSTFFKRSPRRNIRVMIKMRDHDFISRTQIPTQGAAEREGERGHVLAEDHLVRLAVEEVCHSRAGAGDHGIS